jgi:hypothetical protein
MVYNPKLYTIEENIAYCAAGISQKKNFKIVSTMDSIEQRALLHKQHPDRLAKFGIGGTVYHSFN